MNIKNELEKVIPKGIQLTDKEKATIRFRANHSDSNKYQFKPALVTVFLLAILCVLILPSIRIFGLGEHASYQLVDGTEVLVEAINAETYSLIDSANSMYYGNGQIISVSDTLDERYYHLVYKDGKVVLHPEDKDDASKKNKTVIIYYEKLANIPMLYNYTEDIQGHKYTGELKMVEVLTYRDGYATTYTGKIHEWAE